MLAPAIVFPFKFNVIFLSDAIVTVVLIVVFDNIFTVPVVVAVIAFCKLVYIVSPT